MMKKLLFTVLIMFAIMSQMLAQAPQSFKYQAVVRDGAGTVLANQMVGFQLSILQTSETGNSVYTETFTTTTNSYGLVNLLVGEGTPISGDFTTIDWGADSYFLEVELDETGGTSYVFIGTSKLNSVPYALNAKTAETAGNVFSGDYGDLSNTPDLSNYDTDVTDDFDGDYNSLSNQPTLIGDVTGDIDNNTVEKIQGKNVSITIPSSGQVLKWNGTEWAPADDDVTGGSGVDGVVNSASFSGTTNKVLTLGRSNGLTALTANFTDEVNDADADVTNEIQILSISNDTIYLSDGGYVKLPAGFDGDYNSLSNTPTIPTNTSDLTNDSGFITNADDADADATNELNTSAVLNGTDLQITDAGGTKTVDLSSLDNAGTDSQTLLVSGTSLTITGGNTVILQDNVDDADADATNELQTINKSGSTVTLSNSGGSFTDEVNDADADATNELITNAVLSGTNLQITDAGGTNTVDLSSLDNAGTDSQTLSVSGTSLTISGGNTVTLQDNVDDADADATNEIQTLTEVLAEGNNAGTYSIDMNSQNITNAHILGLGSDPSNYIDLYYGSIRDYYNSHGTNGQVLTSHVIGANSYVRWETPTDADATNELITGATLNGTNLEITDAGGTNTVDLSSLDNSGTDSQTLSVSGTSLTISGGNTVTLQDNVDDADADATNELQLLNFSNDTLYLSDGGQVYMGQYSNLWEAHGDDIFNKNTRNVGVGLENPEGKLVVQGDSAVSDTLPLFEVKNKDGQTVFAVYDGGVRVYVNDDPAKANNDKSGFAIGGYRLDKSVTNEYMRVTPDSVRIYIKEENTNKDNNKKGGFAIGGYRLDKTVPDEYLNVYAADTAYVIDTTAQMLWYPLKEAFLAGKILVESGDSVGQNSWATGYVSKSIGDYSQALGNQARAFGNSSTAIGYHANSIGANSYSFGNFATAQDSGSYAFGSGARATGLRSFAIGSTGIDSAGVATNSTIASGAYAYAFGMGAKSSGQGAFAIGTETEASGDYATAIGYKSKAEGYNDISIGKDNITNGGYAIGSSNNVYTGWVGGGMAFGSSNEATGVLGYGMALGWSNYAKGAIFALAVGYDNKIYGTNSYLFGMHATMGTSSTNVENSVLFNLENTTPVLTQDNTFSIMGAQLGIGTLTPSESIDIFGDTPNIEISNNLETESGIIFDDIQDPNNQYVKILYNASTSGNGNSLNIYNKYNTVGGTVPQFTVSPYGVKVGNGSTMKKIQQGSYYASTNTGGGVKTVIINFPSSFSGTPRINVTVKGGNYDDVFAITTRQVSSTSFKVNIYRVDSPGGGWAQGLYLDWMAWE